MRGTTLFQQKKSALWASNNASTDNEVKRLFLLISTRKKSNSAERLCTYVPCAACTVRRLSVQENAGLFLLHSILWVLYIQ